MSKLMILSAFGVLLTGAALLAWGQPSPVPATPAHNSDQLAGLMRAKLASSQKVVEGLMSKDFELIRRAGEEMCKICDATEWHVSDDPVYAHYRTELRRTAKKLILLADEKNLDGSAYTYIHSLTTCVSCHEYCRDVLHVAAKRPDYRVVPIPTSEPEFVPNRPRSLLR